MCFCGGPPGGGRRVDFVKPPLEMAAVHWVVLPPLHQMCQSVLPCLNLFTLCVFHSPPAAAAASFVAWGNAQRKCRPFAHLAPGHCDPCRLPFIVRASSFCFPAAVRFCAITPRSRLPPCVFVGESPTEKLELACSRSPECPHSVILPHFSLLLTAE